MYAIYALVDPRDHTVHYVGQTTDVYARFIQHLKCEGGAFIKNAWIMELRALNRMIIMEMLEEVSTHSVALEREAYWIRHFDMLKEPLSNVTHRASIKTVKKHQMKASRHAASQVVAAINDKVNTREEKQATKGKGFTPAHEEQVLKAYGEILELKLSGEKVTRTMLRDYLGWNSKQYQFVLKPICDKNKILMD